MGIPIHYAVRIDFQGFEKMIDLIGGIDVTVENTFDDYEYPREGYENAPVLSDRYLHVHFDKGMQHMNGEKALEYVRSRHAYGKEGSDFARSRRQQRVILAVKQKAMSLSWINSPAQIKQAITTLGEAIQTDAPISDIPLFLPLAKKIDVQNTQTFVLGTVGASDGSTELLYNPPMEEFGGAWVLIPKAGNWSEIHQFVKNTLFLAGTNSN
jgi:LCP family protein required for cell wall assembly